MAEQATVLENAASLAVKTLEKIQAPAKAKEAEAQAKSDAEKQKTEQVEKEKATKLASEQEAKAKEDARIISEDDTKLKDEEKKRKAELIKAKEEEEKTPDAKIKRVQEASQKRIDEIKSELLSEREKTAQEIAKLKNELEELKKPRQQEDAAAKSKREESERLAKYVEEDKSKPKEQRREMTKEALEEWYLEDPLSATEWIQERAHRRAEERKQAEVKPDNNAEKQRIAKEFFDKQNESRNKLLSKFPSIVPTKEQVIEAKKEAGVPLDRNLTDEEATKVNERLDAKSELFKLCREITFSDPKKYIEQPNGPELVMAEMEKRLSGKSDRTGGKLELTEEELNAKIEEEIRRRKLVDGEAGSSTHGGKKVDTTEKQKSELRQMQERAAKKAGMTVEQLDARIARRGTIKGASSGGADEK